jgi:two-component system cell cycle sensor histidine kinase/response regulator CckA
MRPAGARVGGDWRDGADTHSTVSAGDALGAASQRIRGMDPLGPNAGSQGELLGPYLLINSVLIGAFALLAVHHFVLWWFLRWDRLLFAFFIFNVLGAIYNSTILVLSTAHSVSTAQAALDLRSTAGLLFLIAAIWVASWFSGLRSPRTLSILTLLLAATVTVNLFTPLTGVVTGLDTIRLPWGESLTFVEHTREPWLFGYAVVLAAQVFICRCGVWFWRHAPVAGGVFAVASFLQLAMRTFDLLRDAFAWRIPYPGALSSLMWGVLISAQIAARHQQKTHALRESEERYRLILREITDHAIFTLDPEGRVTTWNAGAERVSGYAAEQVLGKPGVLFLPPEGATPGRPERDLERARKEGSFSGAAWAVRRDGTRLWMEGSLTALYGPDRNLLGFVAVARDRTDIKRSEALWHSVVDTTIEGVLTVEDQESIQFVNAAGAAMFGYAAEELVGKPLPQVLPQLDPSHFFCEHAPSTHARAGPLDREVDGLRKTGQRFPLELGISEWSFGAHRYHTLLLRDLSRRRSLEQQVRQGQKMEALGRLAGGVAHDFNNLLTVIGGYSHLLLGGRLEPNVRNGLEQIRDAGERASALTRQLLAFGRQSIQELKLLDLNEVVRNAEEMFRRLIGEDIELIVASDGRPCLVHADADQLGQVLINLVINARHAMPKGGTLTITTTRAEGARCDGMLEKCAILSVKDTGLGMPPEVKARLFEPFFTTKGPGVGTGFGLAVVHGIVEQSKGFIEVDSELGRGTTFRIHLPLVEKGTIEAAQSKAPAPQASLGHETVMLVEDDAAVRALLQHTLEDRGFHVVVANDAEHAMRIFEEQAPRIDVLLTDVVMPGLSGRELADTVRRKIPSLPVLFTSGYTEDTVLRHGVAEGEVELLRKPFTPDVLTAKLRHVLEKRGRVHESASGPG